MRLLIPAADSPSPPYHIPAASVSSRSCSPAGNSGMNSSLVFRSISRTLTVNWGGGSGSGAAVGDE